MLFTSKSPVAPQSPPSPEAAHIRLVGKLNQFSAVNAAETSALQRLLRTKVQTVGAGVPLIERGDTPADMHIILSGWACRYRVSARGKRQIVAIYVPGDICDFSIFLMRQMDSTITALSPMQVASIGRAALGEFTQQQPRLAQAFWWESLTAASIQREWLVRNVHGGASERIAGLICELAARLYVVGLADDEGFDLPLTQYDLADACGMTSEHTNRTLRELRSAGIMSLCRGRVTFDDWDRLRSLAQFDPSYLHFRETYAEEAAPVATPAVVT